MLLPDLPDPGPLQRLWYSLNRCTTCERYDIMGFGYACPCKHQDGGRCPNTPRAKMTRVLRAAAAVILTGFIIYAAIIAVGLWLA